MDAYHFWKEFHQLSVTLLTILEFMFREFAFSNVIEYGYYSGKLPTDVKHSFELDLKMSQG
jgi:hypothetical protein